MPGNKEVLIRYRIINRLLIGKKSVIIEEMKEACGRAPDRAPLGLRPLAGDIADMRNDDRPGIVHPSGANGRRDGILVRTRSIRSSASRSGHLVPAFEFTSQLLGWGPAVEVISPGRLREEVIGSIKASLLYYTKGD